MLGRVSSWSGWSCTEGAAEGGGGVCSPGAVWGAYSSGAGGSGRRLDLVNFPTEVTVGATVMF